MLLQWYQKSISNYVHCLTRTYTINPLINLCNENSGELFNYQVHLDFNRYQMSIDNMEKSILLALSPTNTKPLNQIIHQCLLLQKKFIQAHQRLKNLLSNKEKCSTASNLFIRSEKYLNIFLESRFFMKFLKKFIRSN